MLKNILNLEGAQELSKQQQKAVNGGQKCQSRPAGGLFENDGEGSGTYNGGNVANCCQVRCRPSFIGIGFGSCSAWEDAPC